MEGAAKLLAPVMGSALPRFDASNRTLKYTSFTTDPVAKKRQRRQKKSKAYPPSDPPGWMIRSCASLAQAWTWAPKRNQVFSDSLISRAGPRATKAGTGDAGGGFAGAVSGACGFSVCGPLGGDPVWPGWPVCADAAPATPQMR